MNDALVQIEVKTGKVLATSEKLVLAEEREQGQIEGCNGRVLAVTDRTAVVVVNSAVLFVRLDPAENQS